MACMTYTKAEIQRILNDPETKVIDVTPSRHGYSERYLFKDNGAYYAVWIDIHPEEGRMLDAVTADRVMPVNRTVTEWVPWEGPEERASENPSRLIPCGNYGCRNLKSEGAVFCKTCAIDFLEDPDAFK